MFTEICSLSNLFSAWGEFRRGKMKKPDVAAFAADLEENIFALHRDLTAGTYAHGPYESFYVRDPKSRHIHKASVRDRLLHHAITRILTPIFDSLFIFDSWSSRNGKGTHRAVRRFRYLAWRLSCNNTRVVWVLKCDIRKFFASIDQEILMHLLARRIVDEKALNLCKKVIKSFPAGIPLGNLTSQLFANVYLHELDRFVKEELRAADYLRYADDFVLIHTQRARLEAAVPAIEWFVREQLNLQLHPDKIILQPYHGGVDFLGYLCFPHFSILRTKTKRRMFRRVGVGNLASYRGVLAHCRSRSLIRKLKNSL